jgi:hypothetical protein
MMCVEQPVVLELAGEAEALGGNQVSHDLTWTRTRAAALGSRRLTA